MALGAYGLTMIQSDATGQTVDWVTGVSKKPFVDIRSFGAVGDGLADDTAAFVAARASLMGTAQTLFIPCGKYKTTSQIDWTPTSLGQVVPSVAPIQGGGKGCTYIYYDGAGSVTAVLRVASDATESRYLKYFSLRDIALGGNGNNLYSLYAVGTIAAQYENVALGPANSETGAGGLFVSTSFSKYDTVNVNGAEWEQWAGVSPPKHGLIFDSNAALNYNSPGVLVNSGGQLLTGTCLWLKKTSSFLVSGAQTTRCGRSLQIDSQTNGTHVLDSLFEYPGDPVGAVIAGSNNTIMSSTFGPAYPQPSATSEVQITGASNRLSAGVCATVGMSIHVTNTARGTILEELTCTSSSIVTDEAPDTTIRVLHSIASGLLQSNFPSVQEAVPYQPSLMGNIDADAPVRWVGNWTASSSPRPLSSKLFTAGRAWRAVLTGNFQALGAPYSATAGATVVEIGDDRPTIVFSSGSSYLTFGVDPASRKFTMTATCPNCGSGGVLGFNGEIQFYPASNIAAGGINKPGGLFAHDIRATRLVSTNSSGAPVAAGSTDVDDNLHARPAIFRADGTQLVGTKIVVGSVILSSGCGGACSRAQVVLSGPAALTSNSGGTVNYSCSSMNQTSEGRAVRWYESGVNTITFERSGSDGVGDAISYSCSGR